MASSVFNPRALQSFSTICLQVFFSLHLGLAPSTSCSLHFFTQSLSSFFSTCPYHRNLFCCSTEIMSWMMLSKSALNYALSTSLGLSVFAYMEHSALDLLHSSDMRCVHVWYWCWYWGYWYQTDTSSIGRYWYGILVSVSAYFEHATLYTTTFPVDSFLTTTVVHCIELLPTPLSQTPHSYLAAFCITFCRSPLIITLVIFIFTLMPFFPCHPSTR